VENERPTRGGVGAEVPIPVALDKRKNKATTKTQSDQHRKIIFIWPWRNKGSRRDDKERKAPRTDKEKIRPRKKGGGGKWTKKELAPQSEYGGVK